MKPSPKAAQTEIKQTCRLRLHQDEIGNISEDLGSSAQSNFARFSSSIREPRPTSIGASWPISADRRLLSA
jgi:hypothetical protein